MTDIKVSIIIPVYNVEKYLRTCLDSIVAQTLPNIEAIIVNDGSKDGSLAILKEYEEQYQDLITVYTTENRGVSHARNYGIDRASGEYLLFVDSDDFIEPNMCELLYEKAKKDDNDIVICKYFDVYANEKTGAITRKKGKAYDIAIGRNFSLYETKFELTHISPFPWDKLYRRSLFEHNRFPEDMRFEDLAIIFQVVCQTKSIGVIEDRLYNYRRASAGSFLSSFSEGTLDIVKALELVVEGLKKQGVFNEFLEEVEYICIRHLLIRYNAIFDVKNRGKLPIKKKMIHTSLDFLEANFPNWRENRYLKYTASKASKAKMKKYKSRGKMIRTAIVREYVPILLVRVGRKVKNLLNKLKAKFKKFLKAKNKKRYLKNSIPGIKLVKTPKDVKYTIFYEKLSVNENVVLFESKHGDDVAGNIFRMILAMKEEKYSKFHIILPLKENLIPMFEKKFNIYGIDYVHFIIVDSKEYLKTLATAKYLITDTSFPTFYIKKPDQVYLNTWHGTPLKAMGRIVPQREYGLGNVQRNFLISDYLLYQNEFSRDIFLEDYMIAPIYNGKIMLSGYPRNSAFLLKERYQEIRSELGIEEMQVMAYMPTWRGLLNKKENKKQIGMLYSYFNELDSYLKDNQVLYVKLHPFVKSGLSYEDFNHIYPFPEEYETYDFLNATDLLITDYSSIMFDYAVSKKPIVLFTYDRREYLTERGMYLNLNEVEFPKADTVKQLVKAINHPTPYPKFFEEFCKYDSKETVNDVCEFLFFNKKPNFSLEPVERKEKKNVLIFISGMKNNDTTDQLIERINALDTTNYNYYLCMKTNTVKHATTKLAELKKEINYIPIVFDVNYTKKDRLACLWAFKFGISSKNTEKLINQLAERERVKYFGNTRFDYVINYSSSDKIIFHMCKAFGGKSVYNFKSFDANKYNESKKYKKYSNYFIRRFHEFDLIVSTDQAKEIDLDAIAGQKLNLYIDNEPKLQFDEVLKEVSK